MDFKTIYEFILNNFVSIVICLGLIGIVLKVANMIIRIIAVVIAILILIKIFFL